MQAVLVGSKKSLSQRAGVLDITHEILERLEAHLRATGQYTVVPVFHCVYIHLPISNSFFLLLALISAVLNCKVTANMKGNSAEEVAEKVLGQASLSGLQVNFLCGPVFHVFQ